MEIVCSREDLSFGVRIASHALGGRTSMPILGGIRFSPSEKGVELGATDLECSIQCTVPARLEGEGVLVCPGQVLAQLVTRLPEAEEVRLQEVDGKVRLVCGEAVFDLLTLPAEEFPELPRPGGDPLCRLGTSALLQAISQTAFAALRASETTRLALTGVDLVFRDGTLKLAATNGYRLAIKRIPVEGLPEGYDASFLIDAQILGDLHRVLSTTGADEVAIYEEGGQLHFSAGPVLFSSRLIQEQFPDFERVIPRDNEIGLFLPREPFLETLRRMEITATEESGAVTLKVAADETAVEVSSASKEKGEGHERVRLSKAPGKDIEIAFKAEYLIDALRRMDSQQVALWLSAPERAGLIEPAGDIAPGDEGFIYVCMPVRLI
ncbi:DNA polymerase III subunit beta [Candidatus Bipolaricaulota bacterium]|nr:DNA polymerase III subunit beta [Candidatus Bipolaricaulota bacterium]